MNVQFVTQPESQWEADKPLKRGGFQEDLFTKGFFHTGAVGVQGTVA